MENCSVEGCTKEVAYECSCTEEKLLFCENHVLVHTKISNKKHSITCAQGPSNYSLFLSHIRSVCSDIRHSKRALVEKGNALVHRIQQEVSENLLKLSKVEKEFWELGEHLKMENVSEDLKSYLVLPNLKSYLRNFKPPNLNCKSLPQSFFSLDFTNSVLTPQLEMKLPSKSLSTSLQPFLYSLEEGYLKVWDPKEDLVSKVSTCEVSKYSSSLVLDKEHILVTGGNYNKLCVVVNLGTGVSKELTPMKTGRSNHSMAFFKGRPGVIGGFDGKYQLSSVETLVDKSWQSLGELPFALCAHTAVNKGNEVYVFGGNSIKRSAKILRWNEEWEELSVRMPKELQYVGVIRIEESFLVLGGNSIKGDEEEVWELNLEKGESKFKGCLDTKCVFKTNSWCMDNLSVFGFDQSNNFIKYSVTDKY